LDPGAAGAAFGLALQSVGTQIRFAAVDDGTNMLNIFTFDPTQQPSSGGQLGNTTVGGMLSTIGAQIQRSNVLAGIASSPQNSGSGESLSAIDAFFQAFDAMLILMESRIEAMDPRTIAFFQMFNAELGALESNIAGHPISV